MKHGYPATLLFYLCLGAPMAAHASSEAAWDLLRQDLAAACERLAREIAPNAEISLRLNEFGSENYAVALVTMENSAGPELSVCVYDKQSGQAQLTTAFPEAEE
ncbi:hypothetical protein [Paracoccus sediminilitoris]|uniref:hypothetical protein n=1 Tax=Paracoccus sediminilitoris TaxID=2202419 RepID=UPI000DB99099|nr:hypothetical protein [Paracoccus sediminilitoris]